MKNPFEVLRAKELELQQIQKEIEALRVTAQLLSGEETDSPIDDRSNVRQMVKLP